MEDWYKILVKVQRATNMYEVVRFLSVCYFKIFPKAKCGSSITPIVWCYFNDASCNFVYKGQSVLSTIQPQNWFLKTLTKSWGKIVLKKYGYQRFNIFPACADSTAATKKSLEKPLIRQSAYVKWRSERSNEVNVHHINKYQLYL